MDWNCGGALPTVTQDPSFSVHVRRNLQLRRPAGGTQGGAHSVRARSRHCWVSLLDRLEEVRPHPVVWAQQRQSRSSATGMFVKVRSILDKVWIEPSRLSSFLVKLSWPISTEQGKAARKAAALLASPALKVWFLALSAPSSGSQMLKSPVKKTRPSGYAGHHSAACHKRPRSSLSGRVPSGWK